MAIEFRCHQCDTLLRTGDDKAGKRAKCPNCGTMVQTPFPESAGDVDDYDNFSGGDYDVDPPAANDSFSQHFGSPGTATTSQAPTGGRMIDCRMCGESIQANARMCRYCGEPVQMAGPAPGQYQVKPTSGMAVASLVLGILGIVLSCIFFIGGPIALLATIFGAVGMKATSEGEREGRGMAVAGLVMGIVGLAFTLLFFAAFVNNNGPNPW